jgi:hypothetical protein
VAAIDNIHINLLQNLGFNSKDIKISVHNSVYRNLHTVEYLLQETQDWYTSIIERNKLSNIYNPVSLNKATENDWFHRCIQSTNRIGIFAVYVYYKGKYTPTGLLKYKNILLIMSRFMLKKVNAYNFLKKLIGF